MSLIELKQTQTKQRLSKFPIFLLVTMCQGQPLL